MYKEDVEVDDSIEVVFDIPKEIHGDNRVEKLILKNSEIITDGIFILKNSRIARSTICSWIRDGWEIQLK